MNPTAVRQPTPITFLGTGAVVDCGPGETVLYAGLRAGLNLSYECAGGGCGTCRAQLVDGTLTSRWEQATGLSDRDRRKGDRVLLCQSIPAGPCGVRAVVDAGPGPRHRPRRLPGRLAEREMLTADTARFLIDAGEPVAYDPGQFVLLEFADGTRRAYSMSRPMPPADPHRLELLIRAKPGGAASAALFDKLRPGDPVLVEGPYGKAYAQTPAHRPVACLAGGTGLAPILAIAEQLIAEAPRRPIDLYVGARRTGDLVLVERLHALAGRGVRVIAVVEEHTGDQHSLPLRSGLALDHLAVDLPDLAGHDLYLAGPQPMIDASLRRLIRAGTAPADRVFFDRFIS